MIEVRREDFSIDEIVGKMKSPRIGAMITYLGTVREFPSSNGLEFENDKYVTKKLEEIEKKAINRFDIADVAIIHRVWVLKGNRENSTDSGFSVS